MRIALDRESTRPLYQQIEAYLRTAIATGGLPAHSRLPSIRALARDLAVNRITVESAYARLEADGLIAGRTGSGTYVLPPHATPPPVAADPWPLWQQGPIARSRTIMEGYFKSLGILADHPDPINLASGVGAPELFPLSEFSRLLQRTIRRQGVEGLNYSQPQGLPSLRTTIAQILSSQGLQTQPEHILVTTGSQQAISLVAQLLLQSGDRVVTENPTYSGAQDLFRSMHLVPVGMPMDHDGLRTDLLEEQLLRHRPKLIYTIPNFQNPTSTCLGSHRRRELLSLARRHNVPILEDDYVGDLRYDGLAQPSLKSLDPGGTVIYVSTFSKMLMPDLRLGFLVAEGPVLENLVRIKCLTDVATSNLLQLTVNEYLSVGRYQAHLRRTGRCYRKRRDAMVDAITTMLLPLGCTLEPPRGGLFCWLELPEGTDGDRLLPDALAAGLAYAPASAFTFAREQDRRHIRLNFAAHPEAAIRKGIGRLASLLSTVLADAASIGPHTARVR